MRNSLFDHITLAHGNGGRHMRELIDSVFARQLDGLLLDTQADAVTLPLQQGNSEIVMTTDGFTVQPLDFPGGDIGSLAIHGTVNDLAVTGATPCYLSLNVFIEEGFAITQLERLLQSMAVAARDAKIKIAAGDTKVLRRGEGGGLYLATTGVGIKRKTLQLGINRIQQGDAILVSGPVGDHGIAVMLAREEFGLQGDVRSDAASVLPLAQTLLEVPGLRFMRDPTRGGIATVLNEIQHASGMGIRVRHDAIPVRDAVESVCEILGYDPYYLACEGRIVAVVDRQHADQALALWQTLPEGVDAAIIGSITKTGQQVILETGLGGERLLDELEDDPLPRIC